MHTINIIIYFQNKFIKNSLYREDGEEEDGDIPDDDQINFMMASYEGEMEMYQRMDAERQRNMKAWWGSQYSSGHNSALPSQPSRLSQAWWEAPLIIFQSFASIV